MLDATGRPVVDALATVLAAARIGAPVLIADPGAPAGTAPPPLMDLPAGTFLVAMTSGSSGRPRPVSRTAESWASSFAPFTRLTGLHARDRVLLAGPLHSTLHLFGALHTLALGAELTDRADEATAVHAVPARFTDLLRTLRAAAPLCTAVVAGAALPAELSAAGAARGITMIEYYGAAELSFVAARRLPAPLRPFPGAEVQIRAGQVRVRSPYVSLGYPTGTAGPFERAPDGFATVGDLGEWRPDGGLRILGRGDAAITTAGATVIAEDVEVVLERLPGIAAACVVGMGHPRLGEVVTAVLELSPRREATSGVDVRAAARAALTGPSLPRRWLVIDRLPRTAGGKVARAKVRAAVEQFARRGRSEGAGPRPLA